MPYKTTVILTSFAIIMDLLHIFGLDDGVFLYMFSPTSWLIELFILLPYTIKHTLIYLSNIVFWFLVGYFIDRLFSKRAQNS